MGSLAAGLVLALVPTRVPFGLASTTLSAFVSFFIGAMFWEGGGLIFGSVIFYFFGVLAVALFMRALWLDLSRRAWFQTHVMRGDHA